MRGQGVPGEEDVHKPITNQPRDEFPTFPAVTFGGSWKARSGELQELIAHTAAHDKVISVGGVESRIGGIAEVCVAHQFRGKGLVGEMLMEAHAWMRREGIPFAMLFGQPKVYLSSGYAVIENPIQAETALIHHWNPFKGKPMIHLIAAQPWPAGAVDLRGPTF